jgi:type VI secretion system protein ImpA
VYPVASEDTLERQSALNCFGDHFGVVDMVRRTPLVSSRQHGQFCLRDIEQAKGLGPIDAAFDELPLEGLQGFRRGITDALDAIRQIDARIREADPEAGISLEAVSGQLNSVDRVLATQVGRRQGTATPQVEVAESAVGGVLGPIKTRQDAIRALEAVAVFFHQTEPSSPVPLLLDRAKRLVSKTFLEVLADIAPGALGEARVASGVKSE